MSLYIRNYDLATYGNYFGNTDGDIPLMFLDLIFTKFDGSTRKSLSKYIPIIPIDFYPNTKVGINDLFRACSGYNCGVYFNRGSIKEKRDIVALLCVKKEYLKSFCRTIAISNYLPYEYFVLYYTQFDSLSEALELYEEEIEKKEVDASFINSFFVNPFVGGSSIAEQIAYKKKKKMELLTELREDRQ